MPHLQREREELLKQAEKISGHSDNEGQVAVHPKRRRTAHTDNVILSSKFVVDNIRDRYTSEHDGDCEPPFWLEFPRADADALEKRGVEVLTEPTERPPRKNITFVKVAEPASLSASRRIEFPQKRSAKGKPVSELTTSISAVAAVADRRPLYLLGAKDFAWLEVYNNFCGDKKWPKLSPHDMEAMLSALDVKKNELTLVHLKSDLSATNRTTEGTARRHEKDYFVLQKFIAYTPSTFDHLDHLNLGRSFGLTSQTAFDIWEYWKLKLQDTFYQPLVFPPAGVFDYRRVSLLAAWNMTTVNYAQRLRHDAERIRLMYDLLQRRNYLNNKLAAKEEELSFNFADLCMAGHAEVRQISPDLLRQVLHYAQELSTQRQPPLNTSPGTTTTVKPDPSLASITDWVEFILGAPPGAAEDATPSATSSTFKPLPTAPTRPTVAAKPAVIFPPLEIKPAPNIKVHVVQEKHDHLSLLEGRKVRGRFLRARAAAADLPKSLTTYEHADNSCCENGPMEDDDERLLVAGEHSLLGSSLAGSGREDSTEPLYMINNPADNAGVVVLKEIRCPKQPTEFRTRLRSWKKSG
ncbi:hypothetical protein BV898_08641 [Hypsibius exemplaris]|uniref:Uncharacterized protein n=1 Tax=Hypsibius exemplaris TaxID=2072580 RepID=A0A1W0WPW8_HYPEX|nr:hypothetical protein BV898_08641 [Hypsibius exemplaris]